MSNTVIKVENLSKQYRLGDVGTGTISHDLNRWWAKLRGKEDPTLQLGEVNDRSKAGISDYVWALKDINFEVKAGEVLGIIGRNGAGKSTLLKILSKTTQPTTGNIKLKGRVASLLEVGTGFHPELSGRDNIFLNGAILGMTKREIQLKFDEIVDFSGVERYIDTPVKRYSSGMYVRLAFAVAAHLEPEILIVDEVLAVGDAEFQKKCLGKMKDVSVNEGRTVLFVSHNLTSIKSLCSKGLLLVDGKQNDYNSIDFIIKKYLIEKDKKSVIGVDRRTDRNGNGVLKYKTIEFLNKDMLHQKTFLSGQELNIKLVYSSNTKENLLNVLFAIAINNEYDHQLTIASNEISIGEVFTKINPNGALIFKIPRLPFISGIYTLNLFCKVDGEIADWVLNAGLLTIEDGDFYQTGRNIDETQVLFLLDHKVQIIY